MKNKKETSRSGLAKYLFVLPSIAVLFIIFNCDGQVKNKSVTKIETDSVKLESLFRVNGQIFHTVQDLPPLPSGAKPLIIVNDTIVDGIANLSINSNNGDVFLYRVLPDSLAIALYGHLASNGVVYITTLHESKDEDVLKDEHVKQLPQFQGGDSALLKWLSENITYPESAIKKGIQGVVDVHFIVRRDGSIDNVGIYKWLGLDPDCDAEAVRAVKSMPKWIPGNENGKPVDTYYSLPIKFKL